MTKRRKRIVIILIIAVLFIILGRIMLPRISMWLLIKEIEPLVDPPANQFTEYDVTLDNGQSASLDGLTMMLPNDYTLRETKNKYSLVYDHPDSSNGCIILSGAQDVSHMNLTEKDNAKALMDEYFYKTSSKGLVKGFQALGHGNPDSAYNVYKTVALLKPDDYNLGNWKQSYAYAICCGINATVFSHPGANRYIYETKDVCGIIFCRESLSCAYAYMFSTDDLNTVYTLSLRYDSLEELYGMLNSIVIK